MGIVAGVEMTRERAGGGCKLLPFAFSSDAVLPPLSVKPCDNGAVAGGDWEGKASTSSSSSLLDLRLCIVPLTGMLAESAIISVSRPSQEL